LSEPERRKLQRAQADVERVQRDAAERVRKARARRDATIAEAVGNGASITDIARTLGLTREAIYSALRRARGA
jgi:hypothetical protein